MPKVYFVGAPDASVSHMYKIYEWHATENIEEADLVQFLGGADVTPSLYGESKHPTTTCNPARDHREVLVFNLAKKLGKPMAGICRGAQFLNVMCGGKLYQDVTGHMNAHLMKDTLFDKVLRVTSTHHQMMKPAVDGLVIGLAAEAETKASMGSYGRPFVIHTSKPSNDVEVVVYLDKNKKVLCFQPHPEMTGYPDMTDLYFTYISQCLDIK